MEPVTQTKEVTDLDRSELKKLADLISIALNNVDTTNIVLGAKIGILPGYISLARNPKSIHKCSKAALESIVGYFEIDLENISKTPDKEKTFLERLGMKKAKKVDGPEKEQVRFTGRPHEDRYKVDSDKDSEQAPEKLGDGYFVTDNKDPEPKQELKSDTDVLLPATENLPEPELKPEVKLGEELVGPKPAFTITKEEAATIRDIAINIDDKTFTYRIRRSSSDKLIVKVFVSKRDGWITIVKNLTHLEALVEMLEFEIDRT